MEAVRLRPARPIWIGACRRGRLCRRGRGVADDNRGLLGTGRRWIYRPGLRLLPVTDEAGVSLLTDVARAGIRGPIAPRLRRSLLGPAARSAPEAVAMVVGDGRGPAGLLGHGSSSSPAPASPALWGGGTLASWRGQGHLPRPDRLPAPGSPPPGVTATCTSTPPRTASRSWPAFGFSRLARTTPYVWDPRAQGLSPVIATGALMARQRTAPVPRPETASPCLRAKWPVAGPAPGRPAMGSRGHPVTGEPPPRFQV